VGIKDGLAWVLDPCQKYRELGFQNEHRAMVSYGTAITFFSPLLITFAF
jgi:hypothetical protein